MIKILILTIEIATVWIMSHVRNLKQNVNEISGNKSRESATCDLVLSQLSICKLNLKTKKRVELEFKWFSTAFLNLLPV